MTKPTTINNHKGGSGVGAIKAHRRVIADNNTTQSRGGDYVSTL
jgi:hypothetical protein